MRADVNRSSDNYSARLLAGANTGGLQETQDKVDFCALNKIKPEITRISMNGIDDAWKKVDDKQDWYRFVIDMGDR